MNRALHRVGDGVVGAVVAQTAYLNVNHGVLDSVITAVVVAVTAAVAVVILEVLWWRVLRPSLRQLRWYATRVPDLRLQRRSARVDRPPPAAGGGRQVRSTDPGETDGTG